MAYAAHVHDLRTMLGLASRLRSFATQPMAREDRELYLTTAAALEARANRIATTLPDDRYDRTDIHDSHQPVNLLV